MGGVAVVIPRSGRRSRRFTVIQQGQVFKLKGARGAAAWGSETQSSWVVREVRRGPRIDTRR
jgi:hypothetical protein